MTLDLDAFTTTYTLPADVQEGFGEIVWTAEVWTLFGGQRVCDLFCQGEGFAERIPLTGIAECVRHTGSPRSSRAAAAIQAAVLAADAARKSLS